MKPFNPISLCDKTILITGASSGIGAQTAIDCSKMGANVILIGRDTSRLNKVQAELNKDIESQTYSFDLTNFNQIPELVSEIKERFSNLNGLVNAAGISTTLPFKFTSPEKMNEFMQTNVYAGAELTRQIIKSKILDPTGSSIIFISSVMASVGESGKSLYSMTKGALESMTKSLAVEYAIKNIRFNSISPAVVETPMSKNSSYSQNSESYNQVRALHPLGIGKTEDIANACIYLLSDASRWVTGTNLVVDGGYTAR